MWLNTLPKGILFTSYGHEELYIVIMCRLISGSAVSKYVVVSCEVFVESDWYEAKPLLLGNFSTPNYNVLRNFTDGQMFWKECARQKKIIELEIKLPTDKDKKASSRTFIILYSVLQFLQQRIRKLYHFRSI
jgi:hypothetical protein